ncbi:MAG: DNA gyrase inhibitor YacG [Pirellulales bacterium]|nr:DNA gyrase inhibitor YacG [Pirellulales bacterium]
MSRASKLSRPIPLRVPSIMATVRCPVCERTFEPEQSSALPFCSERCRQVDLGRWLDERYGMPYEREDTQPERPQDDL